MTPEAQVIRAKGDKQFYEMKRRLQSENSQQKTEDSQRMGKNTCKLCI